MPLQPARHQLCGSVYPGLRSIDCITRFPHPLSSIWAQLIGSTGTVIHHSPCSSPNGLQLAEAVFLWLRPQLPGALLPKLQLLRGFTGMPSLPLTPEVLRGTMASSSCSLHGHPWFVFLSLPTSVNQPLSSSHQFPVLVSHLLPPGTQLAVMLP